LRLPASAVHPIALLEESSAGDRMLVTASSSLLTQLAPKKKSAKINSKLATG
jgi:hypothetical protein